MKLVIINGILSFCEFERRERGGLRSVFGTVGMVGRDSGLIEIEFVSP